MLGYYNRTKGEIMTKGFLHYTLIIVLLLSLGCASTKGSGVPASVEEAKTPTQPSAEEIKPSVEESSAQRAQVEEMALPSFVKPPLPKPLPKREPIDPKRVVYAEGVTILNVEMMPLSDFIIYALGETLKITFFIDEQVKNMKDPITLRMTQGMPVEKVFEIVVGMLEKYGLTVEEKGGALYITKSKLQPKKPMDIRIGRDVPESPAEILQVVPLKYITYHDIDYILRDIFKTGVNVKGYPKGNLLLLSGAADAIREVVEFLELFDVPYVHNKKLLLLKLTYWETDDFSRQLTSILEGIGFSIAKTQKDAGILFVPIKFLNGLLVIAPDEGSARYVLDWHKKLDTYESAGTGERSYIYTPKYSKASDLVDALRRLYMGVSPPASQPTPSGQQPSALTIGATKAAADDKRNVILISASPADYKRILSYLERLDVTPRQVLIEATIAELTLTDDLRYGLEWYVKNSMKEGSFTLQTLGQLGLDTSSGLAFQFVSDNQKFQAAINAFAQENKINILSNPRLMVIDNQEAKIQIGTDIPILSGETKSTSAEQQTTVTTQSVQYRSTGLIVRVKPTINTEGLLALDIAIESSEAQANTLSSVDSPIILTRRLTTAVVASTGQSILLGGLMSENLNDTETKVPLLGDIPLLGHLFKNTSKTKSKTELIIMLKPTIITSTDDATKLTDEIRQGLKWFK